MTKVFIGGSRRITKLPSSVEDRLHNIVEKGLEVLVGDANGSDKVVQEFLAGLNYGKVTVYCAGEDCRNNVGNWDTRAVMPESRQRNFSYYAAKDLQMACDASHGFMLWDAKSNGTLNNMINLVGRNKKVLVYFSPEKEFYKLATLADLSGMLAKCDRRSLEGFDRKLHLAKVLNRQKAIPLFS
ncbi:MAG TPA: hypothetical protein VJX67_02125 [Blastocatellia bacterium]|nr:hypothetical protein [Blastocatellia bacterium]